MSSAPSTPVVGAITQPSCATPTGSIALSGLPATGAWTITGSPSGSLTGTGSSATLTGLAAGISYTFTVTNASGCISAASASASINTQPAAPAAPLIASIIQPTCVVSTGTITLSGLPSTGTWTVTASPGGQTISGTGTTASFTGLAPGNYTFTVSTASGVGGPIQFYT
ncbi:MAG: hypothetical protein ACKO7B_04640, partial [Flavobacteriales bacterium]